MTVRQAIKYGYTLNDLATRFSMDARMSIPDDMQDWTQEVKTAFKNWLKKF